MEGAAVEEEYVAVVVEGFAAAVAVVAAEVVVVELPAVVVVAAVVAEELAVAVHFPLVVESEEPSEQELPLSLVSPPVGMVFLRGFVRVLVHDPVHYVRELFCLQPFSPSVQVPLPSFLLLVEQEIESFGQQHQQMRTLVWSE